MANIDYSKNEFQINFKVDRNVIFEIGYYRCGNNEKPHLRTSTTEFTDNHRFISSSGQGQERLLLKGTLEHQLYTKWNSKHFSTLTDTELTDLLKDIKVLKEFGYPYYEIGDNCSEDRLTAGNYWLIKANGKKAYRIKWDTDGEKVDLPTNVVLPFGINKDDVADYLSDKFGYCVESFMLTKKI